MDAFGYFLAKCRVNHAMSLNKRTVFKSWADDDNSEVRFGTRRHVVHRTLVVNLKPGGVQTRAQILLDTLMYVHAGSLVLPGSNVDGVRRRIEMGPLTPQRLLTADGSTI